MSCTLCPRECRVDREGGQVGFCGVDNRIKIARADLHFWEEPCLSGTNGSGTVFFSGCNLKCVYCQNYKISTLGAGRYITPKELGDIFISLQMRGAHNINLVTAAPYLPHVIYAIGYAKASGLDIPIVYNSSGYESVGALRALKGLVDIYLPDFKYFNDKYAVRYSAAPDYRTIAEAAVAEMFSQVGKPEFDTSGIMKKGVIVRHLMLPGLLFDSKKIIDLLYESYGDDIWISIMSQYTPLPHVKAYPELDRRISRKCYNALVDYAAELGVKNAFVQSGDAADESFIPDF